MLLLAIQLVIWIRTAFWRLRTTAVVAPDPARHMPKSMSNIFSLARPGRVPGFFMPIGNLLVLRNIALSNLAVYSGVSCYSNPRLLNQFSCSNVLQWSHSTSLVIGSHVLLKVYSGDVPKTISDLPVGGKDDAGGSGSTRTYVYASYGMNKDESEFAILTKRALTGLKLSADDPLFICSEVDCTSSDRYVTTPRILFKAMFLKPGEEEEEEPDYWS
ncbi:hypothetical protein BJ508DRAFT_313075 [Ascobolus immersus RN42]|uniref:Uncharacterized protein n=1 Tax=Ascobolus immersus RN42 TaxID=1160509 RepID=A0A3N4HR30_ASCIM|nr:hypothetical protein BJ508DRAFT_313075 [Ascobolus immersus RN42]